MLYKVVFVVISLIVTPVLFAESYRVFPGISYLKDLKGSETIRTIDGFVLFDNTSSRVNRKVAGNSLLLQKITDYSLEKNEPSKAKINEIEKNFNDIKNLIDDKLDLPKKIAEGMVSVGVKDAKGLLYLVWDETIKPVVQKHIVKNNLDNAYLDFVEEIVKGAIDITLEYYNVDLSLIGKALATTTANAMYTKIMNGFSRFAAIYTGFVNTTKLINALDGLVQITAIQKEQARHTLISSFIYDYILKYESDMDKLTDDLITYKALSPSYGAGFKGEFRTIWQYYHLTKGRRDLLDFFTNEEFVHMTNKTHNFIESFGANIGVDVWLKSISSDEALAPIVKQKIVNKNYFMFKRYLNTYAHDYEDLKFNIYFKAPSVVNTVPVIKTIDGSTKKARVSFVKDAKIEIKVFKKLEDGGVKELIEESRVIKFEPFYVYVNGHNCFSDISNESFEYKEAICALNSLGVISSNTNFNGSSLVSRAEFSKMLTNLLLVTGAKLKEEDDEVILKYVDLDNSHWLFTGKYIHRMVGMGFAGGEINPDGEKIFRPGENIIIPEMAKMIVNAFRKKNITTLPLTKNGAFWGERYYNCLNNGNEGFDSTLLGDKSKVFNEKAVLLNNDKPVTRRDTALFLYRAYILGFKEKGLFGSCLSKELGG